MKKQDVSLGQPEELMAEFFEMVYDPQFTLSSGPAASIAGVSNRQISYWADNNLVDSIPAGIRRFTVFQIIKALMIKSGLDHKLNLGQAVSEADFFYRYFDFEEQGSNKTLQEEIVKYPSSYFQLVNRNFILQAFETSFRKTVKLSIGIFQLLKSGISQHQVCYWTDKGILECVEAEEIETSENHRVYDFWNIFKGWLINKIIGERECGLEVARAIAEKALPDIRQSMIDIDINCYVVNSDLIQGRFPNQNIKFSKIPGEPLKNSDIIQGYLLSVFLMTPEPFSEVYTLEQLCDQLNLNLNGLVDKGYIEVIEVGGKKCFRLSRISRADIQRLYTK